MVNSETSLPIKQKTPAGPKATPAQKNPGLESQFKPYVRNFYESERTIGTAKQQLARKCGDTTCNTTYFTEKDRNGMKDKDRPNMTKGIRFWCREDKDRDEGKPSWHRICYVCGEKIYGKANLKKTYTAASEKPESEIKASQFPQDPRASEIEHVADMGMATPFGMLAEEGHLSTLNLEFMQYEYLWAHNRCNKTKDNRSLIYIDEEGIFQTDVFMCLKLQFKVLKWIEKNKQVLPRSDRWENTLKTHMGDVSYKIYNDHYTNRGNNKQFSDDRISEVIKLRDSINDIKKQNKLVDYIENQFVDNLNKELLTGNDLICYPNATDKTGTFKDGRIKGDAVSDLRSKLYIWTTNRTIKSGTGKRSNSGAEDAFKRVGKENIKRSNRFDKFCENPDKFTLSDAFIKTLKQNIPLGSATVGGRVTISTYISDDTKAKMFRESGVSLDKLQEIETFAKNNNLKLPDWFNTVKSEVTELEEDEKKVEGVDFPASQQTSYFEDPDDLLGEKGAVTRTVQRAISLAIFEEEEEEEEVMSPPP